MEYAAIKNIAEQEYAKVKDQIPVPVVAIAQSHDLFVSEIEMSGAGMEGYSGVLTRLANGWSILVNKQDVPARKRFTIAHEIGHFLLHKNQPFADDFRLGETFYRPESTGEDVLEKEANHFAANLLMPEDRIRQQWELLQRVDTMAEFFSVSDVSMTHRLKVLGIITNE